MVFWIGRQCVDMGETSYLYLSTRKRVKIKCELSASVNSSAALHSSSLLRKKACFAKIPHSCWKFLRFAFSFWGKQKKEMVSFGRAIIVVSQICHTVSEYVWCIATKEKKSLSAPLAFVAMATSSRFFQVFYTAFTRCVHTQTVAYCGLLPVHCAIICYVCKKLSS